MIFLGPVHTCKSYPCPTRHIYPPELSDAEYDPLPPFERELLHLPRITRGVDDACRLGRIGWSEESEESEWRAHMHGVEKRVRMLQDGVDMVLGPG